MKGEAFGKQMAKDLIALRQSTDPADRELAAAVSDILAKYVDELVAIYRELKDEA